MPRPPIETVNLESMSGGRTLRVQHMCIDYIYIALEVRKQYESHETLVAQQGKVYLDTHALVLVNYVCSAVLEHQRDTRRRNSKRLKRYAHGV